MEKGHSGDNFKVVPETLINRIEVIRTKRRRKTIGAHMVNDVMHVRAPQHISELALQKLINDFKFRFQKQLLKKKLNKEKDLEIVAQELNRKYFDGVLIINSIEYVTGQSSKFGCCNYSTCSIRISHKIAAMPDWVRDYVLVHELAHLLEPNHSRSFWNIVSRYKLAERARGYLMAMGLEAIGEKDPGFEDPTVAEENINKEMGWI